VKGQNSDLATALFDEVRTRNDDCKVISSSSGKPIKDKKVALGIDALLSGGVSRGQWTDSLGEAHFDVTQLRNGLVSGSPKYDGYLSGTITVRFRRGVKP